ncbi:hypothetical protein ABEW29_20370 [Paenibacillus peoriae]|nr:hypothetical protein [Paenibacillus peoriae]
MSTVPCHGIVVNIKAKTLYNSGMFTAVLVHVPVGIWYIHDIVKLKNSNSRSLFSKQQLGSYYRK